MEDAVESVLKRLGLPYQMRTQFIGRNQQMAPCDFAIPAGGDKAQIIGSAKGFDSTGSKLSDAVREVQELASVRLPVQFVFVIVDGIGWLSRVADFKRIVELHVSKAIDGLYSLATIHELARDIENAARLRGLMREGR